MRSATLGRYSEFPNLLCRTWYGSLEYGHIAIGGDGKYVFATLYEILSASEVKQIEVML